MSATIGTRKSRGAALNPLGEGAEFGRIYLGISERQREQLISTFFRTNIRLQAAFDRCFVPFGMTAQEAAVLVHCADAREISAGKLAEAMGRDEGKISRFVGRLEASGFLNRRNSPHDRRLLIIKATIRGRRAAPRLKMIFEEVRTQIFEGIPGEDVERLGTVLSQMHENAGRISTEKTSYGAAVPKKAKQTSR